MVAGQVIFDTGGNAMSKQSVENGEKLWLEAFNSGDAEGVVAQYGPNARLLPPNADIVAGRAALASFVQGFLDTGVKLSFELIKVYETPDVCTAVGRYEMTFPAGAGRELGKFVEVWVRQSDGSWLIEDDIFNSSDPAPAA
jgi:uncharacterized protein (TIGR02246 family)